MYFKKWSTVLIVGLFWIVLLSGKAFAEGSQEYNLQWSGDLGAGATGIAIGNTDKDIQNELVVVADKIFVLEWNGTSYETVWSTASGRYHGQWLFGRQ